MSTAYCPGIIGCLPASVTISSVQVVAASPPPPLSSQILYLDFGQDTAPIPSAAFGATLNWGDALKSWWTSLSTSVHTIIGPTTYTKPDAGLTSDQINTVAQYVGNEFAPFNVVVTTSLSDAQAASGSAGNFSTVYIGGNRTEVGEPFATNLVNKKLDGVAQSIDFDNANKGDVAYVFNTLSAFGDQNAQTYLPAVAYVIEHEAGHILGLQHVVTSGDLMNGNAENGGTTLADEDRNIDGGIGCQNDYQQLGRNVGLLVGSPSPLPTGGCERDGQGAANRLKGQLAAGLYGAILATITGDDSGPTFTALGDLGPNSNVDFNSPNGTSFLFFGSSTPGGPIDTIGSPFSLDVLSQFGSLDDVPLGDLLVPFSASGVTPFDLFRFTTGAGFSDFGSATFVQPISVPEPPTLPLLAIAVLMFLFLRRRRIF